MKKFTAAMCALVAASAVARPLRHPVYEPDGCDATSAGARGPENLFLNAKVTASAQTVFSSLHSQCCANMRPASEWLWHVTGPQN